MEHTLDTELVGEWAIFIEGITPMVLNNGANKVTILQMLIIAALVETGIPFPPRIEEDQVATNFILTSVDEEKREIRAKRIVCENNLVN